MSKQKDRNKNKKIALIVIAAVLGLAVLLAGGVGITIITSPANKVCEYVKEGEFEKAERLYKSEVRRNDLHKLILTKKLSGYDQTIFEQFEKGETDYQTASEALEVMKEMGFSSAGQYTDKLTEIHKADEAFSNAQKLQAKNDYENAITEYLKISSDSKHYQAALAELNKLYTDYISSTVNSASQYIAEKNFDLAVQVINTAYDILPDSVDTTELDTIKEEILASYKTEVTNKVSELKANEKWSEVFDIINEAVIFDDNEYFRNLKISTVNDFVSKTVNQADVLMSERNYSSAKKLINEAIKLLPNNSTLSDKLTEIEEKSPVSITNLTPINGGWEWNQGAPTDPFGNNYSNSINYAILQGENNKTIFAEWRVYGDYSTLTGNISPYTNMRISGMAYIQIYADDKLVYTSPIVARKTDIFSFESDISGAEYIKIVAILGEDVGYTDDYHDSDIIMSDILLWKE